MTYSIWEAPDGTITLVHGPGPPQFDDGTGQDTSSTKVLEFEAESWLEACRKQNDHYGWWQQLGRGEDD